MNDISLALVAPYNKDPCTSLFNLLKDVMSFYFQDKRYLLLPWIYMLILNVLYETGSVALLTTVHMEREKVKTISKIILQIEPGGSVLKI